LVDSWLDQPVSTLRIEVARICAPLAVLGFMSSRLQHADEWIGDGGFRVPDLDGDWRQPIFVPALDSWAAWLVAAVLVVSGIACVLGIKTRWAAFVFAACLAFVALSDRLAAYTVSKLSPAVMLAVAFGGAGSRWSVDAYLDRKRRGGEEPSRARQPSGAVRFLQLLPVVMYSASGIAKVRGDWLHDPLVLWSHIHDSYQTLVSFALGSVLPSWAWTALQACVLAFEVLAPLWFGFSRTRTAAFVFGVGMHVMIGLMFGPVRWLALLMITLLVSGYLPDGILEWRGRASKVAPSLLG
jgi:uncharacterized membrane protein YphA (DoxX/SURF4 family)